MPGGAALYGEMSSSAENAVFRLVLRLLSPEAYVPSSDTFIEKDASVNEHIEQMRLSATKALLERRDVWWSPRSRHLRPRRSGPI